jgi:hypothetical protein
MPEFYEQVYRAHTPADAFDVAAMWLSKGWPVLPVQPGTKRLVRGFGPTAGTIKLPEVAYYWFYQRKANLAVVCPPGSIVLDFDQIGYFDSFMAGWPGLAKSYSESTPRGGAHLFLNLEDGRALDVPGLIRGVEVKRFCLAYPSKLPAGNYEVVQPGPILAAQPELVRKALEPYFDPGDKCHAGVTKPHLDSPRASQGERIGSHVGTGIITRVKAAWPILAYLAYFEPTLVLEGRGEWREGLCPWHNDHHASLRINTTTNTWRCFACEKYGDIVNWHALRLGVTDQAVAAGDLARYNVQVGINNV